MDLLLPIVPTVVGPTAVMGLLLLYTARTVATPTAAPTAMGLLLSMATTVVTPTAVLGLLL